jgi:hypothetical protein
MSFSNMRHTFKTDCRSNCLLFNLNIKSYYRAAAHMAPLLSYNTIKGVKEILANIVGLIDLCLFRLSVIVIALKVVIPKIASSHLTALFDRRAAFNALMVVLGNRSQGRMRLSKRVPPIGGKYAQQPFSFCRTSQKESGDKSNFRRGRGMRRRAATLYSPRVASRRN